MRLFMMFCVMLLLAGCDTRTSVERAQEAGVLIVGNNAEPQSFDPHIATSVSDFKMINAVMEGCCAGIPGMTPFFIPLWRSRGRIVRRRTSGVFPSGRTSCGATAFL
jgi:hypothetical protein